MEALEQALLWLTQRQAGMEAPPPEELPMPVQAKAFASISPAMLEREARQYLARVRLAQESTAAALAADVWICGDDNLSRSRLCRHLQQEVQRLKSETTSSRPTTLETEA